MPDASGSLPVPASRHAERLARLKLLRRRATTEQRKKRRFSKERLRAAEYLLAAVIDGADLIGEGVINNRAWYSPTGVYLLVGLTWPSYKRLCAFDAEATDFEDGTDAEPDSDDEPGLASTASVNQVKWSAGHPFGSQHVDCELDKADDEANGDAEPSLGADALELDNCDNEHSFDGGCACPAGMEECEEVGYRSEKDRAIVEEARRRYAAASGSEVTAAPARDPDERPGAWLLLQARRGAK
jgi:hypothetical protein